MLAVGIIPSTWTLSPRQAYLLTTSAVTCDFFPCYNSVFVILLFWGMPSLLTFFCLSSKSEVLHLHEPDYWLFLFTDSSFCGFSVHPVSFIYCGSQSYTALSSFYFMFPKQDSEVHQITCPLNSHIFLRVEHASMSWTVFSFLMSLLQRFL